MSTGYTTGLDTWYNCHWGKAGGQTFKVPFDTLLTLVMVYVKKPAYWEGVRISIYWADVYGEPWGDVVSVAHFSAKDFPEGHDEAWITKELFQPIKALTTDYFCMLLESDHVGPNIAKWAYDAGDATYATGHRISTNDNGVTWSHHPNDDHGFYIWGTPPAPPPPPPPAPFHFAPLNIEQTFWPDELEIVLTTDVPCHLYLFYSFQKPWRHPKATTLRGLRLMEDFHWCYVTWYIVEQQEPGLTLTHTFIIPDLLPCMDIWFRFHGTIGAIEVVSDTPIFYKHFDYTAPALLNFDPCPDDTVIHDGARNTLWRAQTFFCNQNCHLTGISLFQARFANPGLVYAKIRATGPPLTAPILPNLAVSQTDGNTLPIEDVPRCEKFEWRHYPFITPLALTAGKYYAVCTHSQNPLNPPALNQLMNCYKPAGRYPGKRWTSINSGGTWLQDSDNSNLVKFTFTTP